MNATLTHSPIAPAELRVADLARVSTEDAFQALLNRAATLEASDLFLLSDPKYVTVAVRRLGMMEQVAVVSTEFGRQIMTYIKAFAELDVSKKRHPADARWVLQVSGRRLDLRINFTPTLHGEDLAIRISDHSLGLLELGELGLTSADQSLLQRLLEKPHGLLLVTGPTGAGKTTTLYACLRLLRNGLRKINTIEDPVELAIDGVRQSQVNLKLGLDFKELLRNVLRQAPDVLMIGEIRDSETMATAIQAANSGLIVVATLHAPTAAGAIQSMLALNANPFFLSNSLLGVVSQRLVRTLCPGCRVARDLSETQMTLQELTGLVEDGQIPMVFGPGNGCECHYRGYAGRTGVFEVMPLNPELRRLIAHSASAREIEDAAVRAGMTEIRRGTLRKIAQGIAGVEEMLREESLS